MINKELTVKHINNYGDVVREQPMIGIKQDYPDSYTEDDLMASWIKRLIIDRLLELKVDFSKCPWI